MTEQMNQLSVPVAVLSQGGRLRNWDGLISWKVGLTEDSQRRQLQWEKLPECEDTPHDSPPVCIVLFAYGSLIGVDWCQGCFKAGVCTVGPTTNVLCGRLALGADQCAAFCNRDRPSYPQKWRHDTWTNYLHEWHLQVPSPEMFKAV